MSGLREIGGDRVVARHLAAMWIVTSKRTLGLKAGRKDGAIDVDRQASEPQGSQGVADDFHHEGKQRTTNRRLAPRQPARKSPIARKHAQLDKALHDRIRRQVTYVTKSPGTDHQHRDEDTDQVYRRVVSARIVGLEASPKTRREVEPAKIQPEDLEATVRGQAIGRKSERQIPVDTSSQIGFSVSHWLWPFGLGGCRRTTSTNHAERPYFKRKGGTSREGSPFPLQSSDESRLTENDHLSRCCSAIPRE